MQTSNNADLKEWSVQFLRSALSFYTTTSYSMAKCIIFAHYSFAILQEVRYWISYLHVHYLKLLNNTISYLFYKLLKTMWGHYYLDTQTSNVKNLQNKHSSWGKWSCFQEAVFLNATHVNNTFLNSCIKVNATSPTTRGNGWLVILVFLLHNTLRT